jgi:hypothetical protein
MTQLSLVLLGFSCCRRVGEGFPKLKKLTQHSDLTACFRFIGLIIYRKIVFVEVDVAV